MNINAPISTIMTENVLTLSVNDPVSKVEDIFKANKIHHIPILDKGKLAGIVSKSDYLSFKRGFDDTIESKEDDYYRMKSRIVGQIMTTGIAKMEPEDKISIAIEIFKENLFHSIPVVKDGHLKGILTTHDIINQL